MCERSRRLYFQGLVVTLFCVVALQGAHAFTDGVVASVAGEPILKSEIMQDIIPQLQEMNTANISEEALERQIEPVFREALEAAIEHFILYKEAKTMEVEVPEAEVEKRMKEVRAQYTSPEAYQQALESAGYTVSDFRDRLRRQMMAMTVGVSKRRQFEREAVISEKDIEQYYRENSAEFSFSARYRLRRIFLVAPRENGEERNAVRETLTALRAQTLAGEDFAELAREHSAGPDAKEGGMMGWVRPGDLVEPLDGAVRNLAVGEVSEVLETEFGFQILRLEEIQDKGTVPYEEARKEIEPALRQQRGEERYRQWMSTLRKRSNVQVFL